MSVSIQPEILRIYNFEDILQKTGWGIYYNFILGFSAANAFSNAIAFMSISLAFPLSASSHIISTKNTVKLQICLILGRAIGGFILSSASDNYGKKCILSKSLLIIFISCFVAAFSYNPPALYLAAFVLGSGVEANSIAYKVYLAEIVPANKRGFYMIVPNLFWTFGYLLITVFTYFTTDNYASNEPRAMGDKLSNWRIMLAFSGGINILIACASALLEIGPRYLLVRKKYELATIVLKQFYAINKSKYSETFELRPYHLTNLISDYNLKFDPPPVNYWEQVTMLIKRMLNMIGVLFKRKFIGVTLIMILLRMSTLLGALGVNIFLAKVLQFHEKSNCFVCGADFINANITAAETCGLFIENNYLYRDLMLLSLNMFLGQIVLLYLIDSIGRKILIFSGLLICGGTSFILAYFDNLVLNAIISSIFLMAYTIFDSTVSVLLIESYPTALRGTAFGLTSFLPSIGLCLVYCYLYMPCQNISIIIGAFMLGSSMISYFIKDLKDRPMME